MRIADVLRSKGATVMTIDPDATVTELLANLVGHNIGAMVVTGPDGPAGVVGERDVVRRLHRDGASILARPVSAIMRSLAVTCGKADTADDVSGLMTEHRVRHVPVLESGRLVGIVSIGDIVKAQMEELRDQHAQLQAYITQG